MMKHSFLVLAALAAIVCGIGTAHAAPALLYGMEGDPPPSGFGPNGPASVTQSTIGVTQGLNSMRVETGGSFVGAITSVIPAALYNTESVLLDLTINPGEEFAGGFADMGVTIFGPEGAAQFQDFASIGALTAGTYELQIDLALSIGPNFPGQSLQQILEDGDLSEITGFQFWFNQNFDVPMISYIDNVRGILVPEPASAMLLGLGALGIVRIARRRR